MTSHRTAHDALAGIGVDVGGTFTDAALIHDGAILAAKVPTTPDDHGVGVMAAIGQVLATADRTPADVGRIAHGMTIGTNALLENRLARTAFVTTQGFGDILELRRQNRADLYRLDVAHPAPIVPRSRVVEVAERAGPDGELTSLTVHECARVARAVRELNVDAIAVCLLFSFRFPEHEQALGAALALALPGVHVSLSCEVLPEIREYERAATTTVDAALTPVLGRYLSGLSGRTESAGLPGIQIMQSNGGLMDLQLAARQASRTVLSGPAAGVIGAALWARAERIEHALTFDMGGTSCDVALIEHGQPGRSAGTVINGHPLHLPMIDVETVSAGGGSIAWADSGGALRVGPHSAGATPGPAAYDNGGSLATVTDAQVVLGRVTAVGTQGHQTPLVRERAVAVVTALADELGLSRDACAEGILRVANHEMARALRVVSVERGIHPADATVIAFGGAGPLHACEVAEVLGISRVIAPATAGVLAAVGTLIAGERRDWVQTVLVPLTHHDRLMELLAPLVARAHDTLEGARIELAADCRYVGQSHCLSVPWHSPEDAADLATAFHAAHTARYGDADLEAPIEVVSLRVAAERPGVIPVIDTQPVGRSMAGPIAITLSGATLWVPAGWTTRERADHSHDIRRDTGPGSWMP